MSHLRIDFAAKQRPLVAPSWRLGSAVLLLGIASLGAAGWIYAEEVILRDVMESEVVALRTRLERRTPYQSATPKLMADTSQIGAAYRHLGERWDVMFDAIESSRSDEIALTSVIADVGKREILLAGEARNINALGDFAAALSARPVFSQVTPSNHRLSDGPPPVITKFDIRIRWLEGSGETS